jgi:predicted dehydrogenase
MRLALIGAGQRGNIYAKYALEKAGAQIVAAVDINEEKLELAGKNFNIPKEFLFSNLEDFIKKGKIADGVIIASMDRDHYRQAMECLDLGYDILLEKPISPSLKECIDIRDKANEKGRKVMVCHVLRYTNFFATIKKIIDSGQIGKVVTIEHAENVGNFHMAHSFVRGNWRNSDISSPIILQKSCHDMDILVWLTGSRAKKISSFGSLTYFKEENAPKGSSDRCLSCSVADSCRFDARKAYLPVAGGWPAEVVSADNTEAGLLKALETGPYGKCVYRCDNNVCDHQVTNIEFENGVTVSFHLSGLTDKMHRTIRVMCEDGEIEGDDLTNELVIRKYSSNSKYEGEEKKICVESAEGFHGGGDYGLTMDFIAMLRGDDAMGLSSIDRSIESHIMAFAAEESRLTGKTIEL